MKRMIAPLLMVAGIAATAVAPSLNAATQGFTGYVRSILIAADERYGGCMVQMTFSPTGKLPLCLSSWLSLSCDGTYTDSVRAYRMLDQFQLAAATGSQLKVYVTDDQIFEGTYCAVWRVDLIPTVTP